MGTCKLDIGAGKVRREGFLTVDKMPPADIVLDIEKDRLPFDDNSVDEIACYEVLEHLSDLIFALNEMHRVLKPDGLLHGKVPGTWKGAIADPTHKRIFIKETFKYFTGERPRNADYGIKPWKLLYLDGRIRFNLQPKK